MAPSTHSADVSQIQADTTAILVDTGTTIPGTITTLQTDASAILVDTGTTIPGTITTVDANVDAILVDTGTTIPAKMGGALAIGNSQSNVLAFATAVEIMAITLDLPYTECVCFAAVMAYGNTTGDYGEFYATRNAVAQNNATWLIPQGDTGVNQGYVPLGRFSDGEDFKFYVRRVSGTGYAAAMMSTVFAAEWFPDGAPA